MSTASSDGLIQKLVESFRTLLDEALVVAIVNDYDLTQYSNYQDAYKILEGLAEHVTSEEAAGFNLSGIAEGPEGINDDLSTTETSNSQRKSRGNGTDTTNSDLASLSSGSEYSIPKLTTFDDDSEESKIQLLHSMFTELKEYDVKHSLKMANGDVQVALDDLLNIQYLRCTDQQPKGIDGFFQPEDDFEEVVKKGKKKKNRKSKRPMGSPGSSGQISIPADLQKEMKRQDEIAYLADRLDLPFDEVSAIYHRKRFNSGATVLEILDQHIGLGIEAQDQASKQRAKELAERYGNVPVEYMGTIVQVTGSFPEWSTDIAALLSQHFTKNPRRQKLAIDYNLKPLPKEDMEGFETVTYSNKASGSRIAGPAAPKPVNLMSYAQATDKVSHYTHAKREAAASAAQLSRRGASNSLYRQAAGYYTGVARDQSQYERQAISTAADALVNEQSTSTKIDLHGVCVQDGVRIARARVQSWWDSLGEFRSDRARQQPFTVITGLGRHNASGQSPLRRAVAAALLQDRWRFTVETGRFDVIGRQ